MSEIFNNHESRMKLKSWKEIKDQSGGKMYLGAPSRKRTQYVTQWGKHKSSEYLSNVVKTMKVNNLVKLFVYKLQRNIAKNNDHAYNVIQNIMTKKREQPQQISSLYLNEDLQAIIISLDIICILIIQTLSTFHGFYQDYVEKDSHSLSIILIEIFCLVVFLLKLIMGFTTPRLTRGEKNQYMKYVALEYVTSIIFIFNLFNFIMTIFKVIFPQNRPVGLVSFIISVLSMPVLTEDLEIVEKTWIKNFTQKQYYTMFKVLLFNIFFVQFISTMFIAVTYFNLEQNWIQKAIRTGAMKPNLAWWQQYFYALYWAIVTSATIGFGDLTPANYLETGFMCILMILGTIVLSFNVSSIGHIIQNLRSIDDQRKQETRIFKRICKDENISFGLQNKISDYIFKSAQLRSQFDFDQRAAFLDKLPHQLREEIQSEYAVNIFSKIPFFRELSHQTLVKFSMKLKGRIYYPGEQLLIQEGKLTKLIFLKHGKIGMAYNRYGSKLNGLILEDREIDKKNDHPFLLNKNLLSRTRKLNYKIVSKRYSVMLELQYDDFFEIIRQNKKDYELYFETLNSMSQIDEEWQLSVCSQCAPKKHSVFCCPKLHYLPYKSFVIDRYLLCPSLEQPAFRDYIRKQNRMKRKSSLLFWKGIYKEYQRKWEINYDKQITKRSKHLLQEQNEKTDISPTVNNVLGSQRSILLQRISNNNINEELIMKLSQKILKMHCCELTKINKSNEPIQMDIMYNFRNFFPRFNPSQLFKLSLKSKNRKIFAFKSAHKIDFNHYQINLKF